MSSNIYYPYTCIRCHYSSRNKSHIQRHFKRISCPGVRNDIELTDDIKQYILQTRIYRIPKKEKEIKIEKNYPCNQPDCTITFKSKSELKAHIKIAHTQQPPALKTLLFLYIL